MKMLKHKKIKNTWLLFDLLTKQIVEEMLETKNVKDNKYFNLIEKYFIKSTNLQKELSLYKYLLEASPDTYNMDTSNYINIILNKRKMSIDEEKLNEEKYNLYGEMKHQFEIDGTDIDFALRTNHSNYKTIASIYGLFEYVTSTEVMYSIEQFMDSNKNVHNYITERKNNSGDDLIEQFKLLNKSSKILTQNILIQKFNEKYNDKLNESQKNIIVKYVDSVYDTQKFKTFIYEEMQSIIDSTTKFMELEFINEVHKIKLQEIKNQFVKILDDKLIKENYVLATLEYYELIKQFEVFYNEKFSI